ncbi:MAG: hypothetical protein ACRESP_00740 [Pseudomonas sp.]
MLGHVLRDIGGQVFRPQTFAPRFAVNGYQTVNKRAAREASGNDPYPGRHSSADCHCFGHTEQVLYSFVLMTARPVTNALESFRKNLHNRLCQQQRPYHRYEQTRDIKQQQTDSFHFLQALFGSCVVGILGRHQHQPGVLLETTYLFSRQACEDFGDRNLACRLQIR